MPTGTIRTVLVTEDDPDVLISDRHIGRSRFTRPTPYGWVKPLDDLNAFRGPLLDVIWGGSK
jgi:hypothetical protein